MRREKKRKGILSEFKEFALKGNVVDLAVGVIIGAAFQSIVNSMVRDVIMPVIGRLVGNIDYSNWFIILSDTSKQVASGDLDAAQLDKLSYVTGKGLPVLAYGSFITAVINFLIMAFIIFLLVKGINKLRSLKLPFGQDDALAEAPATRICPYCRSTVDIAATRCPHCTSELENIAGASD